MRLRSKATKLEINSLADAIEARGGSYFGSIEERHERNEIEGEGTKANPMYFFNLSDAIQSTQPEDWAEASGTLGYDLLAKLQGLKKDYEKPSERNFFNIKNENIN
jgi:hypothetical protein